MTNNPSNTSHAGLKAVAMFEALKGLLVLLGGFGLLALVHHDVQAFVERIVVHLHLNPARLHRTRLWTNANNIEESGNGFSGTHT